MRSLLRRCCVTAAAIAMAWAAAGPALAQDHGGRLMDRLFAKLDADGNGAISSAEGEAAAVEMFERRDGDGGGFLSETEFMSSRQAGKASAERVQKLSDFKSKRFAAADKNGDRRISAEEFFAAAQQRFGATDANGDGQITREEMESRRSRL